MEWVAEELVEGCGDGFWLVEVWDVVQVTLSSDLQFGLGSGVGKSAGRDRMSNALKQLLPPAQ
jgi:hypothetical protein